MKKTTILTAGLGFPEGPRWHEGKLWFSDFRTKVVRVFEGGEIAERVKVENFPYACMLGGPDGKTLFILTSDLSSNELVGRVETVRVEAPKAGFP